MTRRQRPERARRPKDPHGTRKSGTARADRGDRRDAPKGQARETKGRPGGRRRDSSSGVRPPAPRKRFGQHFLERAWVDKLARDVAASPDDLLIEIGPGRGALTFALAASGAQIRAIEIDRDLAADLTARAPANVTVIAADFLVLPPAALLTAALSPGDLRKAPEPGGGTEVAPPDAASNAESRSTLARADEAATAGARVRVVGNLPYNVSSPILFRLLTLARETGRLLDATLMVQREVAVRIAAGPGSGDYGPLSILTALHADVERRFDLPPGAFRPPPKVHSTVIRLRFRPPSVDVGNYATFERLVRTIFQQRRKTLSNALTAFLHAPAADVLARAGIDSRRRPETLTLEELAHLNRTIAAAGARGGAPGA